MGRIRGEAILCDVSVYVMWLVLFLALRVPRPFITICHVSQVHDPPHPSPRVSSTAPPLSTFSIHTRSWGDSLGANTHHKPGLHDTLRMAPEGRGGTGWSESGWDGGGGEGLGEAMRKIQESAEGGEEQREKKKEEDGGSWLWRRSTHWDVSMSKLSKKTVF